MRIFGTRTGKLERQKREVGPDGWTCHVCGDYRPDSKISVFSRVTDMVGIAVTQNIRYCNDRQPCIDGAKEVDFLGGTKAGK